MKTLLHLKKKWAMCGVSLVLILGFFTAAYYPSPETPRAHAGGGVWILGDTSLTSLKSLAENIIQATYSVYQYVSTEALRLKEWLLDGFAFALINMILQQMSKSIITWINSGFQGDPSFIRDIDGFLTGIADRVAGDYIWGSNLNFLCSPFQLDLRLALEIQYKQTRNAGAVGQNQCTLSGVVANIDNFVNGNFLSGGWNGWFQLTMVPQNNTYGSLLMMQEEFSARLSNAKGQEIKLLDFGKGFLSMKDVKGNVVTPGTAIESHLNANLDSARQRIQVADEINEIFAALFSQLAQQAFAGVGGLLGLTQSGNGAGSGEYYNNLNAQAPGAIGADTNLIQKSITTERSYQAVQLGLIQGLQEAAAYKDNTYGVADQCHSGLLTPELDGYLDTALMSLQSSDRNLITLNALLLQYNTAVAQKNISGQQAILQEYLKLQASGDLHTEAEITILKEINTVRNQELINTFITDIDNACSSGGGFGN